MISQKYTVIPLTSKSTSKFTLWYIYSVAHDGPKPDHATEHLQLLPKKGSFLPLAGRFVLKKRCCQSWGLFLHLSSL